MPQPLQRKASEARQDPNLQYVQDGSPARCVHNLTIRASGFCLVLYCELS